VSLSVDPLYMLWFALGVVLPPIRRDSGTPPNLVFPIGGAANHADASFVQVAYYAICMATQIDAVPDLGEFRSAVGMLKLLGDETRLRIIWALLEHEHSVNELAELVGAQPAGVSQHLAKLRLARLVRTRRDGTRIFYVVDDTHVRRLVEEVLSHADHVVRMPGSSSSAGSRTHRRSHGR
jgi:DNA-binding transcriptional ArsR family regulator